MINRASSKTLFAAAILAAIFSHATPALLAQDSGKKESSKPSADQPALPIFISDCTAFLKPEYVESIKDAPFLEGNKLSGKFGGFEAEFAKFTIGDGKEAVYIPKSAILYLIGKKRALFF